MAGNDDGPFPLEDVLAEEHAEIFGIWNNRHAQHKDGCSRGEPRPAVEPAHESRAGKTSSSATKPEWQTSKDGEKWKTVIQQAHQANFVGVAFSGGGIRSATFNLGVLQALADLKLLHRIDYLSTVSGGGYIGSWLAAWTKRLGGTADAQKAGGSFAEVQEELATTRVHQKDDNEPRAIRFLRVFSNYLTPKLGIFSGDTLAAVGIYLRNMMLNLTVVLSLLAAVLLLPRLAEKWAIGTDSIPANWPIWIGVAIGMLVVAFLMILNNMEFLDQRDKAGARQLTDQKSILLLAGAPLFCVAIVGALYQVARFGRGSEFAPTYLTGAESGALGYGAIWIAATILGLAYRNWLSPTVSRLSEKFDTWRGIARRKPEKGAGSTVGAAASVKKSTSKGQQLVEFVITLVGSVGAGALAGWLYAVLYEQTMYWGWDERKALTFGVPLVLGIFLLAGTLHIGLMGIVFRDPRREWWGRLGGWLLLWGLGWLAIFWVALYFPYFIEHNTIVCTTWKSIATKYLTPTWVLTTAGGLVAGKGQSTGKPGSQTWKDVLAKVSPYVFVIGLLCWIAWGIQHIQLMGLLESSPLIAHNRLYAALLGCLAVTLLMAWRVDVNQFSMHLFYRNRLVKCYLGASNEGRSPNLFTGFDPKDDMPLKDLRAVNGYDGPYPVVNSSLNLVKGQDLAWQERKAESFVMTPRFCGYDVWLEEQDSPMMRDERPLEKKEIAEFEKEARRNVLRRWLRKPERYGYRRTENYAFPPPGDGPRMGLAMAISGAAASPNMGFYTTAPVAFLMTVFNVRLGQWLGNPRHSRTWKSPTPVLGLFYLVNELLGGTDDEAAFVYLSDGGHFENMGLYELVKRRCGLIILCDAEADGKYAYPGLGNAIRKCRIDMGIDIDLDVTGITPAKSGEPSKVHYAVGKIHYENADVNAPTGRIIYFKTSLAGDESPDIKNYQSTNNSFPHESTVDQWFSESQFECYRNLGHHVVTTSVQQSKELQGIFKGFGFDSSKHA